MRRAIISPVCSALVMGMGQLINGHRGKGAFLVSGMSLWFLAALGVTWIKVTNAMGVVADGPPVANKVAALQDALVAGGLGWAWIMGGVFAAMWLFAVIDAAVAGARIDRAAEIGRAHV